jgi:hypothetical protein
MSTVAADDDESWTDHLKGFEWHTSSTLSSKYLIALYYTISTIATVGYGDITPRSDSTRLYTIVVMVFSSGLFAFINNKIAIIFQELENRKEK